MSVERTVEVDARMRDNVESVGRTFDETESGVLESDTAANTRVFGGHLFPLDNPDDSRLEDVYAYLGDVKSVFEPTRGCIRGRDRPSRS